ncbi:uncharacterized protein LOC128887277 [Hylaeus anthracinus]|uniref:uncharacterized protein LOC128887277 n=1 Tax=Hylaeus anthracinus TaxID=313031 RepID=UPI0023B96632|nr:uncharacterized protein LOC128887277 [Hylaeus anthracinus]
MVTISQRRRHPRWGMLFIVIFSVLVRHCELTPAKRLTDSSSSSSSSTLSRSSSESRSQNLGSPSDLAWQAWLLLDSQTGVHSSLDSASFLRRITPKSVFIAPALPALPPCAEGYRADTMGRCVKSVNIDQEAHFGFLLQRLNNRYGNRGTSDSGSNNNQKKSNGPLQLNIPLFPDAFPQSSKLDHEETRDSVKIPIVVPHREEVSSAEKKESSSLVSPHRTKNGTRLDQDDAMYFPGSSSSSPSSKDDEKTSSKHDDVIQVAEFVDNVNETSFSEVVDYKIPLDLKKHLNISGLRIINVSDDQDVWKNGSLFNSTEATPMLILLPSTATTLREEDLALDNGTNHHASVGVHIVTRNVTDKEPIGADVPESVSPNKVLDVPLTVVGRIEANETRDGNSSDIWNAGGRDSQETESFYDDDEAIEDYIDSTDSPDEDSAEAEGGEILKHGEAGMAINVKDIKRLHMDKQRQQTERLNTSKKNETSRFDLFDDVAIRFNDTTPADKEGNDEAGSNVSSEVTINDDIILETTLLDVTTDKTKNGSKVPDVNRTSNIDDSDEYLRELFESSKESHSEPQVAYSSQNVHGTVSTNGRTRTDQEKTDQRHVEDLKSDELEAAPSSSESLLYDPGFRDQYSEDDPITEIHMIDEPSTDGKEFMKKAKVSFKTFETETLNFRAAPSNRHSSGYPKQPIKFPSEDVNSIHNQDYKERVPYPLDDGLHSSTKSSVFPHQKPFHRGASLWRTSPRQQAPGQQLETTGSNQRQRQAPSSMSFWTTMPLMRDPSLYSTNEDSRSKTTNGQPYTNNRFPEVSPS